MPTPRLYTIGHSNLGFETFAEGLRAHGIEVLADVRAAPYSRRYPQFSRDALEAALAGQQIRYRWLGKALGGLRSPQGPTPHTAIAEPAFQAYAEHMASAAFIDTLDRLCEGAQRLRIALMCAEANPHHCHRQFIADALCVRGLEVWHIQHAQTVVAHCPHPGLRVVDQQLVYDRHSQSGLFAFEDPA